MSTFPLTYRFAFQDGRERVFQLRLSCDDATLPMPDKASAPEWTQLESNQCTGCPLSVTQHSHCPAALHMAAVIEDFTDLISFDKVRVTVESEERSVTATLPAQQALASFMGLLMPASGCPHTAVFRPMARFHLPFANEAETAHRLAAMYLLAQYFAAQEGLSPDVLLHKIEDLYRGIHAVNRGMAQRLRAATRQDALINAIVLLDVNTALMPAAIHEILAEVRPAFAALLDVARPPPESTRAAD